MASQGGRNPLQQSEDYLTSNHGPYPTRHGPIVGQMPYQDEASVFRMGGEAQDAQNTSSMMMQDDLRPESMLMQHGGDEGAAWRSDQCQMSLLHFARENLLLKRELHNVNSEVMRLKGVLQFFEMQKSGNQPNQQQQQVNHHQLKPPPPKVAPAPVSQTPSPSPQMAPSPAASSVSSSDEPKSQRRYWTDEEHERFLESIQRFGHKNVKAISSFVRTRSVTQVRTHAQKYFLKLARDNKAKLAGLKEVTEEERLATLRQKAEDEEELFVRGVGETTFVFDNTMVCPQILKSVGNPSAKGAPSDDHDEEMDEDDGWASGATGTPPPDAIGSGQQTYPMPFNAGVLIR